MFRSLPFEERASKFDYQLVVGRSRWFIVFLLRARSCTASGVLALACVWYDSASMQLLLVVFEQVVIMHHCPFMISSSQPLAVIVNLTCIVQLFHWSWSQQASALYSSGIYRERQKSKRRSFLLLIWCYGWKISYLDLRKHINLSTLIICSMEWRDSLTRGERKG